jgi:hypothetical protein
MEETSQSVVVSTSLDYQQKQLSHSNYKLQRYVPLQGSLTYTLNNSRQQVQFEIAGNELVNFSRSYFGCVLDIVAQGAANYSRVFRDVPPISSVTVRTRSGQLLLDVDWANFYSKVANRIAKKTSEYLSDGDRDLLVPNKGLATDAQSVRPTNGPANMPYLEPAYFQVSAINTAQQVQYMIPLGSLVPESLFSMNKDIMFPETVIITLNLAPLREIGCIGTGPTNPITGAGPLTGANTYSNTVLYIATEQNQVIKQQVASLIASGKFSMNLPYIHYYYNNRNGAGQQSISLRLNNAHGKRINSVVHIPYNAVGTSHTVFDNVNALGLKVSQFYTTVNNARQLDFNQTCDDATDTSLPTTSWLAVRDFLAGTVSAMNENIYLANFFIYESFDDVAYADEKLPPLWNLTRGKDLGQEVKWDAVITQTGGTNLDHYTYVRTTKTLTILPNLTTVM